MYDNEAQRLLRVKFLIISIQKIESEPVMTEELSIVLVFLCTTVQKIISFKIIHVNNKNSFNNYDHID